MNFVKRIASNGCSEWVVTSETDLEEWELNYMLDTMAKMKNCEVINPANQNFTPSQKKEIERIALEAFGKVMSNAAKA